MTDPHGTDHDPPIARELSPPDPAALERIWRRLDTQPTPRRRSASAAVGRLALAGLALAAIYGVWRLDADPPSAPPTIGGQTYPTATHPPAEPSPPDPTTDSRSSPDGGQQPAPPPRLPPKPNDPPAEPPPPPPPIAPPAPPTARSIAERHGPTPAASEALLEAAHDLAERTPADAAAFVEAGLDAGVPPSAALYVLISDGWAASGDPIRAARAARRALRAAPEGPHATRMRARTVPRNPTR